MEWRELKVDEIPTDFFTNEKYEIQCFTRRWEKCIYGYMSARHNLIPKLKKGSEYRYRLVLQKTITISSHELCILCQYYDIDKRDKEALENQIGRKIKIIE